MVEERWARGGGLAVSHAADGGNSVLSSKKLRVWGGQLAPHGQSANVSEPSILEFAGENV